MPEQEAADTTYFCVVDAEGNAVSGIQSINSAFGSGVSAGDTGVLMNNRMAYWHLDPGHPNRLQPGKRVRHTMNAPMVFHDGKLWAVLGTPGADNQVQVNLQVLTAMIDLGLDPQTAIELPRWTSSQPGQGAELAARGRRRADHRNRRRRPRPRRPRGAAVTASSASATSKAPARCRPSASCRTVSAWPPPTRAATAGPPLTDPKKSHVWPPGHGPIGPFVRFFVLVRSGKRRIRARRRKGAGNQTR